MKGLAQLCAQIQQTHQDASGSFRKLYRSKEAAKSVKARQAEFDKVAGALVKFFGRLYFKHKVIEDFCSMIDEARDRVLRMQKKVALEPDNKELKEHLAELELRMWMTADEMCIRDRRRPALRLYFCSRVLSDRNGSNFIPPSIHTQRHPLR